MTSCPSTPELALIIPVYNEEECIIRVLEEWTQAIRREKIPTLFIIVDDGSTDRTLERIKSYADQERRDDILAIPQVNQGHGQSCLDGYRKALELKIPRIFQIDSDGQCDPAFFPLIWAARDQACAIYGKRCQRDDGPSRIFISWVLKQFLRVAMHTRLSDSNVPYRLYQSKYLEEALTKIPKTFHLANIALALLLEPMGFVEIPIYFRGRQGGQSSVRWIGFARKALQLHQNLNQIKGCAPLPAPRQKSTRNAA
jgi:glycosyltransferase involved in cell wall biosynthesis